MESKRWRAERGLRLLASDALTVSLSSKTKKAPPFYRAQEGATFLLFSRIHQKIVLTFLKLLDAERDCICLGSLLSKTAGGFEESVAKNGASEHLSGKQPFFDAPSLFL